MFRVSHLVCRVKARRPLRGGRNGQPWRDRPDEGRLVVAKWQAVPFGLKAIALHADAQSARAATCLTQLHARRHRDLYLLMALAFQLTAPRDKRKLMPSLHHDILGGSDL
jgi:hypothetical protein